MCALGTSSRPEQTAVDEVERIRQTMSQRDHVRRRSRRLDAAAARLAEASSIPDVRILDRAVVPDRPVKNRGLQFLLASLVGGMALGVGGALARERFDRRVRYPEQVTAGMGLPILGVVPFYRGEEGKSAIGSLPVIEAIRGVRLNVQHAYGAARPGAGVGLSALAGALSGLLGVGGGFIKVPAMNVVMGVPMKPSVATSNFMIGVTAAASAFIYYTRGLVDPSLAAMLMLGVFTGTRLGTRVMARTRAQRLRAVFAVFLAGLGVFMILRTLLPGVNF